MRLLYAVTAEVDPAVADEWNRWHSERHLPEVLAQPGFIRCRKWRDRAPTADGWARFFIAFEVETIEAYERYDQGAAAKRLRADGVKRFGDKVRYQRSVYELVGAMGGTGHVAD